MEKVRWTVLDQAAAALYADDIEAIISHRHDQGADFWATPDGRLLKGSPFTTLGCINYLLELGLTRNHPVLAGALDMVFEAWREDGRFKVYPAGGILPCHTTAALLPVLNAGFLDDERVQTSLEYLLSSRWEDCGWRCNKFSYGRGPETDHSNPFPTLEALDAFRMSQYLNTETSLNDAVEFLLNHWTIRQPIGPCQYGIGSRSMQVEYPFRGYDLFYWVYVLSFYDHARGDARFLQTFETLKSKTVDGQIVVERVVPKLAKLSFCVKGKPSTLATKRYDEILENMRL